MIKKIAIFASGRGSNAAKIIDHFKDKSDIAQVALIVSNKSSAGVLDIAEENGIEQMVLKRQSFYEQGAFVLKQFEEKEIDFIVLAGFLWLVPTYLIKAFPNKIVNIHPALLPAYGGKGMYGMNVHNAVKAAGEKESGITIHYVNEIYDEGKIIFQAKCKIDPEDSPEAIAKKVQQLEHKHFASTIEKCL